MGEPLAHDAGGRPLFPGTPVRFTDDVAHLYEDGTSGDWVVERLGDSRASVFPLADKASPDAKSRLAACKILQIRDKATGVWVFAPALWLATYALRPAAVSPERDEIREIAMVFFHNRNGSMRDIMIALLAWATDYVHRTNPPADREVEPRQSVEASTWTNFLHDLSKMFNDGNVGCFASPESVRAAVEVTLSALKSAQKHRKEAEDRAGELEVKYEELKERVETARKAFGG